MQKRPHQPPEGRSHQVGLDMRPRIGTCALPPRTWPLPRPVPPRIDSRPGGHRRWYPPKLTRPQSNQSIHSPSVCLSSAFPVLPRGCYAIARERQAVLGPKLRISPRRFTCHGPRFRTSSGTARGAYRHGRARRCGDRRRSGGFGISHAVPAWFLSSCFRSCPRTIGS